MSCPNGLALTPPSPISLAEEFDIDLSLELLSLFELGWGMERSRRSMAEEATLEAPRTGEGRLEAVTNRRPPFMRAGMSAGEALMAGSSDEAEEEGVSGSDLRAERREGGSTSRSMEEEVCGGEVEMRGEVGGGGASR
jgi:hypothetical protein